MRIRDVFRGRLTRHQARTKNRRRYLPSVLGLEGRQLLTNVPPFANSDEYNTLHDSRLSGEVTGSDEDGGVVSFSVVAITTHGTLTLEPDGYFTYVPDAGFVGDDDFTFTASDGQADSDPATVVITVTNSAPFAGSQWMSTPHDQQIVSSLSASDYDGDPLTFSQVSGPSHGTLTFNPDGSYTYKPNYLYIGTDSFSFKVNDGITDSTPATVTIVMMATPTSAQSNAHVEWDYSPDNPLVQWLAGNNSVSVSLSGNSQNGVTFEGAPTLTVTPDSRFGNTLEVINDGTPVFITKTVNGQVINGYQSIVDYKWSYSRTFVLNLVGNPVPDGVNTFFGGYLTIWMESKITLTIWADGSTDSPVVTNTDNSSYWIPH